MKRFLAAVIIICDLSMLLQTASANAAGTPDGILNLDESPAQILTVEQTIAAVISDMGLDQKAEGTPAAAVKDKNGLLPSDFARKYVDVARRSKALPSPMPSFASRADKLFAVKFILALLNYKVWQEPSGVEDKQAIEAILLDIASSSGISKKEAGLKGLAQDISKADLKKLLKRWKIKELGNDTMKSGWAFYSARNLKAAICVFKMNIDAGLHSGTTKIYYANSNYGLGLTYAHNDLKRYYLAFTYLDAAVKSDPGGPVGKNAKNYIDNKLMPVQLDFLYMPDKILTYEEVMALVGHYMWLDIAEAQNYKAVDKSGHPASSWTAPYVRLAFKRNYMPYVPDSFSAVAPRYWIAEYLMNVKGYQQYDYEKFYDFDDTKNLPADARMFISAAVERGIMNGIKQGLFDPYSGIKKHEMEAIINSMKSPVTPQKTEFSRDNAHKIVQTYYANLNFDSYLIQNDIISRRSSSLDMINFDCTTLGKGSEEEGTSCVSTFFSVKNIGEGLDTAKKAGIKRFLALHNFNNGVLDGDLAHRYIKDEKSRSELIKDLLHLLELYRLDGVHVDFENIAESDRDNYSGFIARLSDSLKQKGKLLTVALGAYFTDNEAEKSEYDYSKIGKYADYVNIILYDDFPKATYPKTGADGPVSNIIRIERVLKYATIVMPASKILLGSGAYGIDFNLDKKTAVNVPFSGINKNAYSGRKDSVKFLYDYKREAPYIEYTDSAGNRHRIWYENAASMKKRLDLVNKYRIAGISFYWLGSESDEFYKVLNDNLTLKK